MIDTRTSPRPQPTRIPKRTFTARQQAVLELKSEAMTRTEIAEALGITFEAVKRRINRAKKRAIRKYGARLAEARGTMPARQITIRPFTLRNGCEA